MYRRAICFLEKDDQVLLMKGRGNDTGLFVPPGGPVIKAGLIDSIKRIYKNKTGLKLLDPVLNMEARIEYALVDQRKNVELIDVYAANKFSGELSDKIRWFSISSLIGIPMKQYDFAILSFMRNHRQKLYMSCFGTDVYDHAYEPWPDKGSEQDVLPGCLVQKIQKVQR